jgi:hypothetical protein
VTVYKIHLKAQVTCDDDLRISFEYGFTAPFYTLSLNTVYIKMWGVSSAGDRGGMANLPYLPYLGFEVWQCFRRYSKPFMTCGHTYHTFSV